MESKLIFGKRGLRRISDIKKPMAKGAIGIEAWGS